jgi:hypothetical protein
MRLPSWLESDGIISMPLVILLFINQILWQIGYIILVSIMK